MRRSLAPLTGFPFGLSLLFYPVLFFSFARFFFVLQSVALLGELALLLTGALLLFPLLGFPLALEGQIIGLRLRWLCLLNGLLGLGLDWRLRHRWLLGLSLRFFRWRLRLILVCGRLGCRRGGGLHRLALLGSIQDLG